MITDRKRIAAIAIFALAIALFAFVYSTSTTNGTDGTNGTNAVLGTLVFALHGTNASTSYNSYDMNSTIVPDVPEVNTTYPHLSSGDTLLQNWTSPSMNLTLIPAGAVQLHIHATRIDGGSHDMWLYYDAGIVNSTGGNFSSVALSSLSPLPYGTTDVGFDITGVMLEKIINLSDRMELRVYVHMTGNGASPDVILHTDGLTISMLTIPAIPIDLTGIINNIGNNTANINLKVNKSGDTMSGNLNMGFNQINNASHVENVNDGALTLRTTNTSFMGWQSGLILSSQPGINNTFAQFTVKNDSGVTNSILIYPYITMVTKDINMQGNNITNCGNCVEPDISFIYPTNITNIDVQYSDKRNINGTWTFVSDSGQTLRTVNLTPSNGYVTNTPSPSINNSVGFGNYTLYPGNYTIYMYTLKSSNVGIVKLMLDGAVTMASYDGYSSTNVYNTNATSSFTINDITTGEITLTVTGKNPSSSGYVAYVSGLIIKAKDNNQTTIVRSQAYILTRMCNNNPVPCL